MLFVVTGPSGCGKSTILAQLVKDVRSISFSVSHTTRPRRPSEAEGRQYYLSRRRKPEADDSKGHVPGVGRGSRPLVRDLEAGDRRPNEGGRRDSRRRCPGARSIRALRKDATFVFVLPPRAADLRKRLLDRGEDDNASIRRRLNNAKREIREASSFDYVIVNDRLNRAVLELEAIVLAARCRAESQAAKIRAVLRSFPAAKR